MAREKLPRWSASKVCAVRQVNEDKLDTHGYVILDRARRILPGLKSVLMDKETLLKHRNLWGEEFPQNCGVELPSLLGHEIEVYEGLCRQTWGRSIRLEQERIPWASAVQALGKPLANQAFP